MSEEKQLQEVIEDLELLFKQAVIEGGEFDNFLRKLKSKAVKHYLKSLRAGSQPERALKDAFFSYGSEFVKLFGDAKPEVFRVKTGFIDYVIEREIGKAIDLEIKPPFVAIFEEESGGKRIFKRLKKEKLNYKRYEEQIEKYLKAEGEYLIFTNIENWFFFSESYSREITKPYAELTFPEFIKEFKQIGDLYKFADRKEELSIKEPLDKKFFKSLDAWVKELKKVGYTVDEKTKNELIINLINKFIFVQSLDKLWVAPNKYFERTWSEIESRWGGRKKEIIKEFLERTDNYFYKVYDTELFIKKDGKNIFDFVKQDKKNVDLFFEKLKLVLGVELATTHVGWVNGIIQYNFRHIDEDILGKAYEKYLADIRKEAGVYYTPKYITQYIVENTIGKQHDELLNDIEKVLKERAYDKAEELIKKFTSIRVLDPACGSGSFLIKALRLIWNKYQKLNEMISEERKKYDTFNNTLVRSGEAENNAKAIAKLQEIIGPKSPRELISRIILRHIHGNDLDNRALEVAKVNIWLEAIKLSPTDFHYDQLPEETNHVLPDLEMNLGNGDSLVGLPEERTLEFIKENHKDDFKKLFELRKDYLNDPTKEEAIKEIEKIKAKLRKELDEEFKKYLKENNLPEEIFEKTKPFYWALDFWYVYLDEDLEVKEKEGFDAIIGNPPYFTEVRGYKDKFRIYRLSPTIKKYYEQKMDVFYFFIERGLDLLKDRGYLSYIIMEYWKSRTFGAKLREKIVNDAILVESCNFKEFKVFEDAPGQHNSTLILQKSKNGIKQGYKVDVISVLNPAVTAEEIEKALLSREFTEGIIFKKLILRYDKENKSILFAENGKTGIINKLRARANYIIPGKNISVGVDTHQENVTKTHIKSLIKKNITPQFKEGEGIFVISNKDKSKNSLTPEELKLIRPFYHAHQINAYHFEGNNQDWILYISKPYLEYDKKAISKIAKENSLSEKEALKKTSDKVRKKYPNITKHLDRFQIIITSDMKPYGLHRPRDEKIFENKNKIISVRKTPYPKFAHVSIPYYMNQSVNYILIDSSNLIPFLVALFNSKLSHYYFKTLKTHGEQLQIDKEVISRYPIYIPHNKQQKPIIQLVDKITLLKKIQHKFREIWRWYSKKYRSDYRSIGEILTEDKKQIQEGNFDKAWTSEASIYPNGKKEILEKEFDRFKVRGEDGNNLKVYGISGSNEELILEVKAKSKELRDILYLEILGLFDSRSKIKTLKHIFDKTAVSVIQPNILENSGNLINGATKKFDEWLKEEKLGIKENNIVKIDDEIQDVDNQIDAHVFKLYGLSREEIITVLDSLKVQESIKEDILEKIERIES